MSGVSRATYRHAAANALIVATIASRSAVLPPSLQGTVRICTATRIAALIRRPFERIRDVFLTERRRVPPAGAVDQRVQIGASGCVEWNGHAAPSRRST